MQHPKNQKKNDKAWVSKATRRVNLFVMAKIWGLILIHTTIFEILIIIGIYRTHQRALYILKVYGLYYHTIFTCIIDQFVYA